MLFYHMLLVLHPRHKLHYFKNAGWQTEWIEKAEEIVRTVFNQSYGSLDTSWAPRPSELEVCACESPPDLKVLRRRS